MQKEQNRPNTLYPLHTETIVRYTQMYQQQAKRHGADRLSTRLVKCASVLEPGEFVGWQMIVPQKGLVRCSVFGSGSLCCDDLLWASEKTAKAVRCKTPGGQLPALPHVYELFLPAVSAGSTASSIGFGAQPSAASDTEPDWPFYYSSQFEELIQVMRITGGMLRAVIGPADTESQKLCRKNVLQNFRSADVSVTDYIGKPVQMRVLLRLPSRPSIRLRTVLNEACKEAVLRSLGTIDQSEAAAVWNDPLQQAPVLPDYAARILMLEPELHEPVVGMEICKEAMKKIPASHKNTREPGAVLIGKAEDTTGVRRKITIGELDLKRHFQIVGQTGTGKSTLLATLILSAIEQGHGLTFFDPHGSTIDTILRSVPEKYAGKIRVVRIGDADNPVPLNIWDSDDPEKEERNISDLCELFGDIFNPPGEIFVGPRYERWLSTFAKASIAFLGKQASLESISVISQSQDNMLLVCKAITGRYPELIETIRQEYGTDRSNDFQSTLNWYLCKFQRLTSVEQLRKTLGAGTNALDFPNTIDTDTVTLIDLATPVIGTHAARIIGTLLLMKLWNAVTARKERDRTHLVVVDEASLFQTNPMPRMLAESR
ncbi:MAG: DUF87 domain-containing protein, partial [Oscillospiraceae bacterium]|nr:DUF87 domain-containing protein [Oscillospiraceae bacterium]